MARRNTYKEDEILEEPFDIRHLLRAWVYIKKQAGKMALALILSAIGGAAALVSPIIVQRALDIAIPQKDVNMLYRLVVFASVFYIISVLFTTIRSRVMVNVSQDIIYQIRTDLFKHLQKLPFQYYDDRPHGKILVRVVNYVNSVSDMLSNGLINVILEIINLVFIVIFMFAVDVKLSLVVLAGVPFLMVFMFWIKNKQRRAWQAVSNKNSNLNAYLQENIVGARITQIFAREDENADIFRTLSNNCRKTWMTAVSYSTMVWPGIDIISVLVRAAIYIFGLLIFAGGNETLGTIVAISSYAARFWQPIMNLGNIFNGFINNMAYLERIFEAMDEPVTVDDAPDAVEMKKMVGEVTFDHVSFSYEKGKEVLHDVSFTVKPGESVALVGPTGAGKSTIVSLISRFYNVDSGRILIDGQDISKVTLQSLRSQMGIMLQDSFIFSGTIEDNIRYGKLDATEAEIRRASKTVCAHNFIKGMSGGYRTEVKERGALLSQGQKQLISFARTLLSDPSILVLDEATSSIDVQTEKALQQGLDAMLAGRTSFIIAHRLSTITKCDKIMYINDGGITECGSHEELMAKKGDYYHLYTAQIEGLEVG
ncbi:MULTISPECIES: ABC transporter ATP-binding protein [unclassified Butyrivibrio]|uniref:ABC transporter ATP-binding protein n=1 Tax=unclassified Butyrivibrio TaxID=2639466 RepID=UPI0003B43493|nr:MULTISPECIES: ABC transporter ATP-binding protein [unclassified Butyrivibrio]MDC7294309.1 ABC transporter ATP-binding protein/permease [Butyrivibrio sp. DSM 10294]